jgi:branched-chain amino acid transport system substrate-binding protein
VLNYLKAVRATGSKDAGTVRNWLREQPDIEDAFARHGKLLPNGRFIHDMLVARVKTPAESKYPWDFYDVLGVVPAAEAFRTIEQSKCKLR